MPANWPVALLSAMPWGKVPETTSHCAGLAMYVVFSATRYGEPAKAGGIDLVTIRPRTTVSEKVCLSVCPAASVAPIETA